MQMNNKDLTVPNDFDYIELWEQVKEKLTDEINILQYDVWVKSLEPIGVRGDALILKSESAGGRAVVKKSYGELIEKILQEQNSYIKTFEIVIEEEINEEELFFDDPKKKPKEQKKPSSNGSSSFDPKFTFENFVVGPSNEFTVAAAKAVADNPGGQYNPLFIYGGSGLGKTHILQAIGNQIVEEKPELTVVYITTEQFTNEFIETVSRNELEMNAGFRKKYRTADVLLVDDIHSIIGKPRVQEEFFHTFNALTAANKQIVLTCDRPPKEINPLEDRLKTRFEWGLMTDIGIPEIETRIAILKRKTFMDRQIVDDDVLEYIASAMTTSVRELEGYLARCMFYKGLSKKPKLTLDVAAEALKNYITESKTSFDSNKIIEKVCIYFDVSKNQLLGRDRKKELSYPRQICMYLLDNMLQMPNTSIGKIFGKDHATVIYCKGKVDKLLKTDKRLQMQIKDIKDLCTSK